MTALQKDLYIEQGASFLMPFQWCQNGGTESAPVAGDPIDLTGFTARMQIRQRIGSAVLVDATTDNQAIVLGQATPDSPVDLTNGWVTVCLSDTMTDALDIRSGVYDLEAKDASGFVYRLLQGKVTVSLNVTRDQ